MNLKLMIVQVILASIATSPLHAALILQFSTDNSITGTQVNVGDNFSINLFIAQNSPETRLTTDGLFSFGTRGTFSDMILQATGGTIEPVFNPLFSDINTTTSGQVDSFGALPTVTPKSATIQLATFNFKALAPGSTTILFGDLDSMLDDFTLDNLDTPNIDNDLFGPSLSQTYGFNVQVNPTAVPEPSSAIAVAFAGIAFVFRKRGRILTRRKALKLSPITKLDPNSCTTSVAI